MTNDRSLAALSTNFMLREVNYHRINALMEEVASIGIVGTPKETMSQMLSMFNEYRESSNSFRECVLEFLKKTEKAPDLKEILEDVMAIDQRHLDIINAVDEKIEYFLTAAIKKSASDRLMDQINFFMENTEGAYDPEGKEETTEEEPAEEQEITEEDESEETEEETEEEQEEEETTEEETEESEDTGDPESEEEQEEEETTEEEPAEEQEVTEEETPTIEPEPEPEPEVKPKTRKRKAKTKKKTTRKRRLFKKGDEGDE